MTEQELLDYAIEIDKNLDDNARLFLSEMAEISETPYYEFLVQINDRSDDFKQEIIIYSTVDKKKKIVFKFSELQKTPQIITVDGEDYLSCMEYSRQDLKPEYEFFNPTFDELKRLSKANKKAVERGTILFKKIGVEIKPKFESRIIKSLK